MNFTEIESPPPPPPKTHEHPLGIKTATTVGRIIGQNHYENFEMAFKCQKKLIPLNDLMF